MRLADTNILIYAVSNRKADIEKRARAEATLKEPDLARSVPGTPGVLQSSHQAPRTRGPDPRAGHGIPAAAQEASDSRNQGGTVRQGDREQRKVRNLLVEWMEMEGNSNSSTSVASLEQLRERHGGRLNVIWDNAPTHRGVALREYLRTPDLNLRLVNLSGYSPDFNADEAIWDWTREEATGNLCLGTRAAVQERVGGFLAGLPNRPDVVR